MKNVIIVVLILAIALMTVGCATDQNINGKKIAPYGWANMDTKVPGVHYHVSVGNVVWSVITFETVVVPVVLTGWYLFEADDATPASVN